MVAHIRILPIAPENESAQQLINALDAYQLSLYPAESNHLDSVEELARPNVHFIGAFLNDDLAGIAAVKKLGDYGEIKRLYVKPECRGYGLAVRLMAALEHHLIDHAVFLARLETGVYQPEALALYEHLGYRVIGPFGQYREDPLSVFMEKLLTAPSD